MFLKYSIRLLFLLFILISSCSTERKNLQSELKGLWKLDRYESFDIATGIWINSQSRLGYTGFILYDGMGHMSTQIQPPGFYDFSKVSSLAGLDSSGVKSLLEQELKSFCYFANYKLSGNDKTIEHYKISSNIPKEINTTVKRSIEFRGDTLILTAFEPIGGLKTRLRWVRQ